MDRTDDPGVTGVGGCTSSANDCSLRQAVVDADGTPGFDAIDFAIPGGGAQTFTLATPLPAITDQVVIDGSTEPGYAGGSFATPLITIDGTPISGSASGLSFGNGSTNSQIFGLAIVGFNVSGSSGITLSGTISGIQLQTCYIGILPNGTASPNATGIIVSGGANNNFIGSLGNGNVISGNSGIGVSITGAGTTGNSVGYNRIGTSVNGSSAVANGGVGVSVDTGGPATTVINNLISGNGGQGIYINTSSANGVVVQGNLIGTDVYGTAAIPNTFEGIELDGGAQNTQIGGAVAADRNVISGNGLTGVRIQGAGTTGSVVNGNYIGIDATGTAALGNGNSGVIIDGVASNTIGSTTSADRNIISGNTSNGVIIQNAGANTNTVEGNYIGTDVNGSTARPNTNNGVVVVTNAQNNVIGGTVAGAGNLISGNVQQGVAIAAAGTTGNVVEGNLIGTNVAGTGALPNQQNGVLIDLSATGNTVGGATTAATNVISGNAGAGVLISDNGTSGNFVQNNLIGLDVNDANPLPNQASGVSIASGASGNTIGGNTAVSNVLSGNTLSGVEINNASSNTVSGNIIGTDWPGGVAIPNRSAGISILNAATSNTIGGTAPTDRNLISGNGSNGIGISGAGTSTNTVLGNVIGLNTSGTSAVANGGFGVLISGGASSNTIGGPVARARNIISGNTQNGVQINASNSNIVESNYIGTDVNGTARIGNGVNGGLGLDQGSSNNTIGATGAGNVLSGNQASGLFIDGNGTNGNTVQGNFIGTDPTGTNAVQNAAHGVEIRDVIGGGPQNNLIGGTSADQRNIISGNSGNGVQIRADDSGGTANDSITGNYIGVDATGAAALPNGGSGIVIMKAANHITVGGSAAGAGNVISGNGADGITITDASTTANTVQGNIIGANVTVNASLPNGGDGVLIESSASSNVIGGTAARQGNVIAHNNVSGVGVLSAGSVGNSIRGNSISGNNGLGIDLGDDGVTANDALDPDTGPNNQQNWPGIYAETSGAGTVVGGTLQSTPNQTYVVDIYANSSADASGHGQGETYVGSTGTLTTDASGNAPFTITDNGATGGVVGTVYSATATRTSATDATGAVGDTSEFSADFTAVAPPVVVNTNDSGTGSLRAAVVFANANPGTTVPFAIPTTDPNFSGGVYTIKLTTDYLDKITAANTFIDGSTEPGFATTPVVFVDGGSVVGGANSPVGLWIDNVGTCAIKSLGVVNFPSDGVAITGASASANLVLGCYIGINAAGTAAAPNGADGVVLDSGAHDNFIGSGTTGNVISGNANHGVVIGATAACNNNVLDANLIGTNAAGTAAVANAFSGVALFSGSTGNTIGGTAAGSGNVISGNGQEGISLLDARQTTIQGNLIGTSEGGTTAVPNGDRGILLWQSAATDRTQQNLIGGASAAARNIISGNTSSGAELSGGNTANNVVRGNYIGTAHTGTAALGNAAGVALDAGSNNNSIGENLISGNHGTGVNVLDAGTSSNIILSNFIGTDATGAVALPNASYGVSLYQNSSGNTVGGTTAGAGNVISGNSFSGVNIDGTKTNVVQANFIGTNAAGTGSLPNGGDGVLLWQSSATDTTTGNVIGGTIAAARNVISGNTGSGVDILGTNTANNAVQGNYIGANAAGAAALGNTQHGVIVLNGAHDNTIGGTTSGARNIISGNSRNGVGIGGNTGVRSGAGTTGNIVQGNYMGTDASGSARIANTLSNVAIGQSASNNTIGGTVAGAGNVISGSLSNGVTIFDANTSNNTVQGNLIGTNAAGTAAIPNAVFGVGISASASNNLVGGATASARNVISGNASDGVNLQTSANNNEVLGNYIGTDSGGTAALPNLRGVNILGGASNNVIGSATAGNVIAHNTHSGVQVAQGGSAQNAVGNTIVGNSIVANGGLGINLQPTGEGADLVTPNDAGDLDTGPNNLQNFPVLTNVTTSGNTTTVAGTLNSVANAAFNIDFYRNTTADASGFGEGEVYLGRLAQPVTTDASGNASFSFDVPGLFPGQVFTATATSAGGDTSEFAQDRGAVAAALTLTVATNPATNPVTFSEGAGPNAAVGTVTRNTFTGAPLVVHLTSSLPSRVSVPASLTIPAGAASVTFPVAAIDDAIVNGTQQAIITATATALTPATATVTVTDNDTAGITVTPTSGLVTTEAGGTASFIIVLNTQPSANVTIGLTSSKPQVGQVTSNAVTFTPNNYNIPQGVTVVGQNDHLNNGDQTYTIVTAPAVSNDPNYNGINPPDVAVTNRTLSFYTVTPTSGLVTTELGGTAQFSVKLTTQPRTDVVLYLYSSNQHEGLLEPRSLTFTPANFATAQRVTVTGVADHKFDGDQTYRVTSAAISADPRFDGTSAPPVLVTNLDNDAIQVNTPRLGLITSESGTTSDFTVQLRRQPTGNVRISFHSSNLAEDTVAPTSLTFTPANYNTPQLVRLTGVRDFVPDNTQLLSVVFDPVQSTDLHFKNVKLPDLPVRNRNVDVPGVTVTPTLGLVTTESGGRATFTVRLNTRPAGNVTVTLHSTDLTEGTVAPTSLTFTPASYNSPQTVTVTGVDDTVADGNVPYRVTGVLSSTDADYNGRHTPDVFVTNLDNESPRVGVVIRPNAVTLQPGATQQFDAFVSGAGNAAVVWSIAEGRAGGIIDKAGFYTAPAAPGLYHIIATSALDPTAVGRAAVTVPAPVQQPVPLSWGDNRFGQLGRGTTAAPTVPGPINGLDPQLHVTAVAAGGAHSLALTSDGHVWAWGYNGAGQLGDGSVSNSDLPVAVSGLGNVGAIAAGWYHSLAMKRDGTVWAWGFNESGQLGDGSVQSRQVPVQIPQLRNVRAIAAGVYHSMALRADGTVWTWGNDFYGQLGDGGQANQSAPVQVSRLAGVKTVSAGAAHSVAVLADGSVRAWGWNAFGQLGDGTTADSAVPVALDVSNVAAAAAGYGHTLLLVGDGSVRSCGNDDYGQLGRAGDTQTPLAVVGLADVQSVAAGAGHSLALKHDGTLWSWGDNAQGALGDGTRQNRARPAQVGGVSNVTAVSAGYGHSLAIGETNTVALATAGNGFSSATASAGTGSVALFFSTALDATTAGDARHYGVVVAGHVLTVESSAYDARRHAVVLSVPDGALHAGDRVTVSWSGLQNSNGGMLASGNTTVLAR